MKTIIEILIALLLFDLLREPINKIKKYISLKIEVKKRTGELSFVIWKLGYTPGIGLHTTMGREYWIYGYKHMCERIKTR